MTLLTQKTDVDDDYEQEVFLEEIMESGRVTECVCDRDANFYLPDRQELLEFSGPIPTDNDPSYPQFRLDKSKNVRNAKIPLAVLFGNDINI